MNVNKKWNSMTNSATGFACKALRFMLVSCLVVISLVAATSFAQAQSDEAFRFVDDFNEDEVGQPSSNWDVANKPGITGRQSTILVQDLPDGMGRALELNMQETAATGQDPFFHTKLDRAVEGHVVIEAKVMKMDVGHSHQNILVRDENNSNGIHLVRFSSDGYIYAYDGSQVVKALEEPYDLNEWYRVTAVLDTSSSTYDLYIDGTKVKEGLSFSNSSLNNVMYVRMQAWARVDHGESTIYFDDVKVLEPGIRSIGSFADANNVDVELDQLNIDFNTPMDLNTLNPKHILFTNETDQQLVSYSDYTNTDASYSFQFSEPLKPYTVYSIQLQGVKDVYGQPITKHVTFQTNDPRFDVQENLLSNGSFEVVDDTGWASLWGTWAPEGNPQYSVDEAVYKDGSRSLKISADERSRGNISQRINLAEDQRGKAYRIEQWMKTEDFTGSAFFRIQAFDQDDNRIDYIQSDRIRQSQADDWTLVEMDVDLSEDAVRVTFEAFFEYGVGTVWYDDTRIYEYIQVSDFVMSHEKVSLLPGETEELTATMTLIPENATKPNVIWESSDESIVTVDEGIITAYTEGIAVVTARTINGIKTDTVVIVGGVSGIAVPDYEESVDQGSFVTGNIVAASDAGESITYTKLTDPNHGTVLVTEGGEWIYHADDDYLGSDQFHVVAQDELGRVNVSKVTLMMKENLMSNGSFEIVDGEGWASSWSKGANFGNAQYTIDETVYKEGAQSLKISASENSRAFLSQSIYVAEEQRGKSYRIEQWMKAENLTGMAYFCIQIFDQAGDRLDFIESNKVTQANDWELAEIEVNMPEEAARIQLQTFLENGAGTVWYDATRFYHYIPTTGIDMVDEEVSLLPGETKQLEIILTPEEATGPDLIWESSDESIVTVEEGFITAHANGIAEVSVRTRNEMKASSIVIVGETSGITVPDYEESVQQGGIVDGKIEAVSDSGEIVTYTKLTDPNDGVVHVKEDGQWTYYADQAYIGADRFHVVVEDEAGHYNVSKVKLDVLVAPRPPVLGEVIQPTDKNTPVDGEMMVTEPNGEALSFHIEVQPLHGQAVIDSANGNWTYTPDTDYVGKDSFTVRVENEHNEQASTIVRLYTAPTAEEIIDELKANNPEHNHPRLLVTVDDFSRMRSLLEDQDENMVKWFERIKAEADALLTAPPFEYVKPDGLRMNSTSSRRVKTLAFTYKLTGNPAYAQRAWEEMEFVASDAYPDWSPGHFLDTATMTEGISLGYDWLYDYLSEEQRAVVRQAIAEKGLSPAVPMYSNKSSNWVTVRNNWSFVTNAGMTMGALAIAEEEEELAGLILREAYKSIQYGIRQYAPDGSTVEGPGYWEYGAVSLVYFLSVLENSFGHDFEFSDRDGIAEMPLYPIHINGPNGSFNHGDNNDSLIPGRLLLWFADRFNIPEYTWYHQFVNEKTSNAGMYDMMWYRPEIYGAKEPVQLDKEFELPKAITMRSSWSDPNALFVGFKGGVNGAAHGDLDTGSFVFDAHGIRWALDLGLEDYNLPGFWEYDDEGQRWNYYRKTVEGHNTLVIQSPSSTWPSQEAEAVSDIIRTEFERPEGSFAIADLTPAYRGTAASVKRGTALIDHRRQFLIQDEIKLKEPSELYWFMHTRAQIEIDDDGTTAWLTQDGRQLVVQLVTPAGASFSVMDAEPLPSSPNPPGQNRNLGIKKLMIHLEDQLDTTIAVRMIPIVPGETPNLDTPVVVPLEEWTIEASQLTQLDSLTINGEVVANFSPDQYVYDVEVPTEEEGVPSVSAQAADGYEVTIVPAGQLPGTTKIEVVDPNGLKQSAVYYVVFQTPSQVEMPEGTEEHTPVAVSASTHDGNIPENTLDGDLDTRWSAEGEQWIQYDLGEVKDLSAVAIAWYQGNVRQSYFQLELSEDGEQWQTVHEGFSAGDTTDFELTMFEETPAQYVRIQGFGNSVSQWNSIAEVMIYGPSDVEAPTPVTTASLLELVASMAEEDAFATEQTERALSMHLTAVQVFERQQDVGRIVQHMGGFHVLLDHQRDQELISEQVYSTLKLEVDALINQWQND